MAKWISISELSQKTGVGYRRIFNLAKRWLPHKMATIEYEKMKTVVYGKSMSKKEKRKVKIKTKGYLVDYDAWLEIPTFLREHWAELIARRKKRKNATKV